MILSPLLNLQLRPRICSWIKQSRNIRPSVKISKDKFQLSLDVRNFSKDEIRVKAREEYVIIEGKQEKKIKRGYIMRQFVRKFKLPQGCSPQTIESELSPDGILTITAPRKICEPELPCETVIPIRCAEQCEKSEDLLDVKDIKPNPCDKLLKKSPGEKPPDEKLK